MVSARHRLSAMPRAPGITAAPFSSLLTSEAPEGTWPARPPSSGLKSIRIQTRVFWALMLPTRKTLLSVLSSQKPSLSYQTLLPPRESVWDQPVVLTAWQAPGAGLVGQGSAHWAEPVRVGHEAKQGYLDVVPFLFNPTLPITGRLPQLGS